VNRNGDATLSRSSAVGVRCQSNVTECQDKLCLSDYLSSFPTDVLMGFFLVCGRSFADRVGKEKEGKEQRIE